MQILWHVFQIAIVLGTVWVFTEIIPVPKDVSLGSKAAIGILLAFGMTVLLSKLRDLVARHKSLH